MYAEIITIGDEILIGQIVDTNSTFISKALNKIGVSVYQITTVQDERAHILKALEIAQQHADIVIITGGLGPTKDDITKNTLAEYFDDTLKLSDAVLDNIKELWEKYIKKPLSQLNIDQALVPSKCTVLMNKYGSAPGMWFENNGKVVVSLPGVPYEMKALMENEVIPKLQQKFNFPYIIHKTVLTHGMGESTIALLIEDWEDALPSHIKLAYLPNLGRVRLRLTGKSTNKLALKKEIDNQISLLLPQIKDIFVGYEEESSIESLIGKLLAKKGKTLATAESCTGGKIAELITSIPGASKYFKGSVVSYATQAKVDILNVPEDIINEFSVVSTEVAEAMASKALDLFDVDYAIATTGNAGPEKGDSPVAVGTVCIAIATKERVYAQEFQMGNHRIKVINKAVNKAFEMLQKEILKK